MTPRPGGTPTYGPETAARRRLGQLAIRIDPELAERIRAAARAHPAGVSGWLADAARLALEERDGPG